MLVVDLRNPRITNFHYAIVGDKNSDVIYFYSHFTQYANSTIFVKALSEYVADKYAIPSEDIEVQDDMLIVKFTLTEELCYAKKLALQLQFEYLGQTAQSRIVYIDLGNTLDIEGSIQPVYPHILEHLQEEIDNLKLDSIAHVSIDFENDTLTIVAKDVDGAVLETKTATIPMSSKQDVIDDEHKLSSDLVDDTDHNHKFATAQQLEQIETNRQGLATHEDDTNNPHSVTKSQVGLGNVDNTSDADKPVSTDQQTALDGKVDKTTEHNKVYATDNSGAQTTLDVDNGTGYSGKVARRDTNDQVHVPQTPTADDHAGSKKYIDTEVGGVDTALTNHKNNNENPHSVTKAQVGLGSVVDTGDSATPTENGTAKFTTGGAYTMNAGIQEQLNVNVHVEGNSDEISYNGDTVTKTSPYKNLKTGTTGSRSEVIKLADDLGECVSCPCTIGNDGWRFLYGRYLPTLADMLL